MREEIKKEIKEDWKRNFSVYVLKSYPNEAEGLQKSMLDYLDFIIENVYHKGFIQAIKQAKLCVCKGGFKEYLGNPPLDKLCVKCGGFVIWKIRTDETSKSVEKEIEGIHAKDFLTSNPRD